MLRKGFLLPENMAGFWTTGLFSGVQVSRTFYARGQTGQQLLLGAYSALSRQLKNRKGAVFPRHDMLDVILVDGKAKGVVTRKTF